MTWKELFKQIGVYVGFLLAAIIGRTLADGIILRLFGLEDMTNGATEILWGSAPFGVLLKKLIFDIANTYVLRAMIYFPLAEVMIAIAVVGIGMFFIAVKQKNAKILILGIGGIFSLFILSFLQGKVAPYRTSQVFGVFVAFAGLLLMEAFKKNKHFRMMGICILSILVIHQAMYLSYFLNLNHLRSEEEIRVLEEIGEDLALYSKQKPVVFVGNYTLSDYIAEASSIDKESKVWYWYSKLYARLNHISFNEVYESGNRKIVSTNVKSMIQWAAQPENGQGILKKTFRYLGYDYLTIDNPEAFLSAYYAACAEVQNYWDNVGDLNWKNDYAILETEDYVIVHLK